MGNDSLTSNSMGTFACPHCKRDTPHKHFIDSKGYIHDFMEPNKILGRGPGKYSELLPDPMPETPEPATYSELEAEIERLRPQAAMAEDFSRTISAQLDTIERLRAELEHAPIAKVTVAGGLVVRTGLYAPGLPDGEHDLYCEPVAAHETPAVKEQRVYPHGHWYQHGQCIKCHEPETKVEGPAAGSTIEFPAETPAVAEPEYCGYCGLTAAEVAVKSGKCPLQHNHPLLCIPHGTPATRQKFRVPDEVVETVRATCANSKDDPTEIWLTVRAICEELQARRVSDGAK